MATETFNNTKFGIRQQKLKTNKEQNKLYQFLQENGVTALQTICYEKKKYVHFQ